LAHCPDRHKELRGSDVAEDLQLPIITTALRNISIAHSTAVVGEHEMADLVSDGELDSGGTTRRVELDPGMAVERD
jgi:hypothetical protein